VSDDVPVKVEVFRMSELIDWERATDWLLSNGTWPRRVPSSPHC
jgi:hypothetical protein